MERQIYNRGDYNPKTHDRENDRNRYSWSFSYIDYLEQIFIVFCFFVLICQRIIQLKFLEIFCSYAFPVILSQDYYT